MSETSGRTRKVPLPILIGAGLVLALLPALWWHGLGVLAWLETLFRAGGIYWLLLLLVLLPLSIGVYHRYVSPASTPFWQSDSPVPLWSVVTSIILLVLAASYLFFVHSWVVDSAYSKDVQKVNVETDYTQRAPWVVANNFASRDQDDVVGDRLGVHHIPAEAQTDQTTRYTSMIKKRHWAGMAGYEAVQSMQMPLRGQVPPGATTFCDIPDSMNKRLASAWPWHSLNWSITAQKPLAHWDRADTYGYCDAEGNPVVVIPLWAYEGLIPVTKVPDGAAVYTPQGLTVMSPEELVEAQVEGPTYPRSLAAKQRDALRGMDSLAVYWSRTTGYETTSKDVESVNLDNDTEFTLMDAEGQAQYVTPLVPRGSSESMVAVSSVPATQSPDQDGRTPVTVNDFTNLPSTSTLANNIKESSVQGDLQWTTRWSAGMAIYEMVPSENGHWTASIGQGQAVSYRADIAPDGVVSVVRVESGGSTDETTPPVVVDGGKPLSEMSDEELLDLMDRVVEELRNR